MILHFTPDMESPKVWIRTDWAGDDEPVLFVDNQALVRHCIKGGIPYINERWLMSDRFYADMVGNGTFIPIADLNQAKSVCEEKGWPEYAVNL